MTRLSKLMSTAFPWLFFAMLIGLVAEACIPHTFWMYKYLEMAAQPVGMLTFICAIGPIAFADAEEKDEE